MVKSKKKTKKQRNPVNQPTCKLGHKIEKNSQKTNKKNYNAQFSTNSMLKDKIEKI